MTELIEKSWFEDVIAVSTDKDGNIHVLFHNNQGEENCAIYDGSLGKEILDEWIALGGEILKGCQR